MNIRLCVMTKLLMRQYFRGFCYDPDTFEDKSLCGAYAYSQEHADRFFEKNQRSDRVHFAVMLDQKIIGDLYLKQIDPVSKSCVLSIHMQNDSVKNKGYGTKAEQLALAYAFEELQMKSVYADALIRNERSRHVLNKVGFKELHRNERYSHYVCRSADWHPDCIGKPYL